MLNFDILVSAISILFCKTPLTRRKTCLAKFLCPLTSRQRRQSKRRRVSSLTTYRKHHTHAVNVFVSSFVCVWIRESTSQNPPCWWSTAGSFSREPRVNRSQSPNVIRDIPRSASLYSINSVSGRFRPSRFGQIGAWIHSRRSCATFK